MNFSSTSLQKICAISNFLLSGEPPGIGICRIFLIASCRVATCFLSVWVGHVCSSWSGNSQQWRRISPGLGGDVGADDGEEARGVGVLDDKAHADDAGGGHHVGGGSWGSGEKEKNKEISGVLRSSSTSLTRLRMGWSKVSRKPELLGHVGHRDAGFSHHLQYIVFSK